MSHLLKHLPRYALLNVDLRVNFLQIYANLNIREGEKYTRGKLKYVGVEGVTWKNP